MSGANSDMLLVIAQAAWKHHAVKTAEARVALEAAQQAQEAWCNSEPNEVESPSAKPETGEVK